LCNLKNLQFIRAIKNEINFFEIEAKIETKEKIGFEIVKFLLVSLQDTDKFTDAQFDRYNLDRRGIFIVGVYIYPDLSRFYGINSSFFSFVSARTYAHMYMYTGRRVKGIQTNMGASRASRYLY